MISRKISQKTKLLPCWARHITSRKTKPRSNVWNIIMVWALCITKHTLILNSHRISWQMPKVNLVSLTQLDSILLQKMLNLCQLKKILISDRKIRSKCLSECQTAEVQLEGKLEESFSNILLGYFREFVRYGLYDGIIFWHGCGPWYQTNAQDWCEENEGPHLHFCK